MKKFYKIYSLILTVIFILLIVNISKKEHINLFRTKRFHKLDDYSVIISGELKAINFESEYSSRIIALNCRKNVDSSKNCVMAEFNVSNSVGILNVSRFNDKEISTWNSSNILIVEGNAVGKRQILINFEHETLSETTSNVGSPQKISMIY